MAVPDAARVRPLTDPFNAFVHLAPQAALADGPLAGLRVAVKDNVDVAGMPTRAASPALHDEPASADAPVVAALRAAGAAIVGKANMHELAFGVTSDNPWTGRVDNPAAPGRIAGGSSGGTAAAIAAGLADAGIATDTGGSARIPAALCGIAGFRPTSGRYSSDGVVRLSRTFDTAGPMAPTAAELQQLDAAITGTRAAAPPPLAGMRLSVPRALYWDDVEEPVARAVEGALAVLADAGCELVEGDVDGFSANARDWHLTIVLYECEQIWRALAARQGESLGELAQRIATPQIREAFERLATGEGPSEAAYRRAVEHELREARLAILAHLDETGTVALVAPAVPIAPPPADTQRELFDLLTRNMLSATIAAQPSVCIPIGGAVPVGLLLDGRPREDDELLALAVAVEQALG